MFRKTVTVGSTVLMSALALTASASADVKLRTDLGPGDVVRDHGVAVVVPPPGHAVQTEATLVSGGAETLTALTERDGTVVLSGVGSEAMPALAAEVLPQVPPAECDDGAYHRSMWTYSDGSRKLGKWKSLFRWWFNPTAVPADVDRVRAREATRRAVRNVVGARNDCGMADQVTATQDYLGDATTAPNITSDSCAAGDGKNVVGYGKLALEGALAVECSWGRDDGTSYVAVVESDVKMNTAYRWYADLPAVCLDRYSIEGVMTHEFGHTFQLAHVDEAGHGNLTMSTSVNATCRHDEATLGKGDVWGLQALY